MRKALLLALVLALGLVVSALVESFDGLTATNKVIDVRNRI